MTRGNKSSEKSACYRAFYAGLFVAVFGIYMGSDLGGLAMLITAVSAPMMFYAGARTAYKRARGEDAID